MVLKLYGFPISNSTRRVAIVLHETRVPFVFVPLDKSAKQHKTPNHLKFHPFGQVPYIDDDGFILYESRAICRYIAAKYANQGTPLIPTDPKANALFEQAASIEYSNFNPAAYDAFVEGVLKPRMGLGLDEAAYEARIAALSSKLDVYDVILGKQKYLAGDELSLADLFHLPYGNVLRAAGSDVMDRNPNVARWLTDLSSRESWQAVKDGVTVTSCGEMTAEL